MARAKWSIADLFADLVGVAPTCTPHASGTAPNIAAIVDMMIGRKRFGQA